jgi:hypothetical protein
MDVDREPGLDRAKQTLEIVELERRVQAALDQDLRTPELRQFLDLAENRLPRKDVSAFLPGQPVEVTELALHPADVRN